MNVHKQMCTSKRSVVDSIVQHQEVTSSDRFVVHQAKFLRGLKLLYSHEYSTIVK